MPSKKQIILCSNVLYHKDEFNNALKRQLIMLYDFERAGAQQDKIFSNCKLLACSEIRAANFHSRCFLDPGHQSKLRSRKETKEMRMADAYCVKQVAKGYL